METDLAELLQDARRLLKTGKWPDPVFAENLVLEIEFTLRQNHIPYERV